MNVLIAGGAGYVGSILRPALEASHTCRYLDLRPVPGAEARTIVGDVNDPAAVAQAVTDQQAILYLAMGTNSGDRRTVGEVDPAFNVNVRGLYRVLSQGLAAGAQRFCLASSLSVYKNHTGSPFDGSAPADSWDPYGLSKRVGEFLCQAAAQEYPQATVTALRLISPRNEQDWTPIIRDAANPRQRLFATGPEDLRELFLKVLQLEKPGCHIVQATGDVTDEYLPNHDVRRLLGWSPQSR